MIAADTNALVSFFQDSNDRVAERVSQSLKDRSLCVAPIVLTELLSDPKLSPNMAQQMLLLPLMALLPGYWQRAGELRRELLRKKRRASLADVLVAQAALDFGMPLLTADRDFSAIQSVRKLVLL